ncbi:SGNH/GDSL hydrolase family protein [Streptosporangium sp. NPDC051022]|uniref:SGNH/GDSL hydrolase family protein n=1 Tax=Streptosporangium sp. NPDC051022 TaxID=3155752 RepID=UPI00342CE6EC
MVGSGPIPVPVLDPPATPETRPIRAPLVMIVGDSFTVGSGPVRQWESYAAQAARELGWQLVTAGARGTGFVNPGRVRRTFQTSFTDELSWRPVPDLLIVSGGHNDRTAPGKVHQAAKRLLGVVRSRWPQTRVVVVGPIWMGRAPRWAYGVRDAIAVAAGEEGAIFLDPLGRAWGRGAILGDGVHPTFQGHARLARWLVTALREHGAESEG